MSGHLRTSGSASVLLKMAFTVTLPAGMVNELFSTGILIPSSVVAMRLFREKPSCGVTVRLYILLRRTFEYF